MRFFKEIFDQKISDPDFKQVYDKECHICAVTVKLVEAVETGQAPLEKMLEKSGVTAEDYTALKNGDCCNPGQVKKMYEAADLNLPPAYKKCPRKA